MSAVIHWKSAYRICFYATSYGSIREWLRKEYDAVYNSANHGRITIKFKNSKDALAFRLKYG